MEENCEIEFPAFPYKPYPIQMDFMKFLYKSLDKGGISMLESPTGTGKTLSIICSALQWLVDKKRQESTKGAGGNVQEKLGNEPCLDNDAENEPDWMRNFVPNKEPDSCEKKKRKEKKKYGFQSKEIRSEKENDEIIRDLFNRGEEEEVEVNLNYKDGKYVKVKVRVDEEDEEFLLEEYESEEESGGTLKRKNAGVNVCSSSDEEEEEGLGDEEEEVRLKIYFCSRTHSQLSQFIKELRKTTFASELMAVCLGSRKNLCINEEVVKLGTSTRINERCLELQKSKKNEASKTKKLGAGKRGHRTKASSGCPMLGSRKIEKEFKNEIIQLEPLDIEDLVRIGRSLGTCPYYGSRRMVPAADLVVLPYQSLLSKSSRESLGLSLKNNVIIIDEAHNLADTLISMYDAKVTLSQLNFLQSHLEGYFQRFRNLLGPGNRRYIQTLMVLTRALLKIQLDDGKVASHVDPLFGSGEIENAFVSSMAINEFLFALHIDNINLVKLLQYMKETNLIHKVSGYGDKVAVSQKGSTVEDGEAMNKEESAVSCFQALADMLFSLTNNDGDGRVLISRPRQTCHGQEGHIKYVMLTGEKIFSEIVNQAHAVILAGGTLQPIEETKERLFPSLQPDRLHFFSCGHIIPPENILPIVVKHGPSGQSFDFSYKLRSLSNMIEELGLLLCNLVTVVPEGVVVFFPSFDYEGKVYDAWKSSGILTRIMKKKRVFREPRKNTDVEAFLREYKETIDALSTTNPTSCNGAILFAVVGGKISEGINFSDGTGRCVIMIGLPYPSPSDIELIERVKHIEGLEETTSNQTPKSSVDGEHRNGDVQTGFHILRSCKGRGKEYYENLCMKAVNQSIGRAIRHINDYAAILLVDVRYASDPAKRSFSHSTGKLPQWIRSHLVTKAENYGEIHRLLHQFFKFHISKGSNQ
ncbi:RAD3-like DNA-binding helicase protein [Abeliophyllum distichum]|uniref:RAD3-like DNA-binding helicase protein n=1 Tax=Abeliophyllum distichum TaxID=126358 RepID=A0ABD1RXC8_9LAMI